MRNSHPHLQKRNGIIGVFARLAIIGSLLVASSAAAETTTSSHQVLAFYYGWYANPDYSHRWRHWKGVDNDNQRIANAAEFPAYGAYDSHDPQLIKRQVEAARSAGITGFIASWWGRGSFEDRGIPLLLRAAAEQGLLVSAYYEQIDGNDASNRKIAAVADLDYLIQTYGKNKFWLRKNGKPVIFIYGRALAELSPAEWRSVLQDVRRDNPTGAIFIPDSLKSDIVSVFDGASAYNITGNTAHKTLSEIAAWGRETYPKVVRAAGPYKISTTTIIPGYDDSHVGRPTPRPITDRWNGETYKSLWREAIAAHPEWVLITSWNEWHEGTQIEPSVQDGTSLLEDTARASSIFLNSPAVSK